MDGSEQRPLTQRLDRLVQQHLESLLRAGLTQIPVCREPIVLPQKTAVTPERTGASRPVKLPAPPAARQEPDAAMAKKSQPAAPVPPAGRFDSLPADRGKALAVIQEAVRECTRCSELATTRTQTVFGVGHLQPKLVFVGEAPGADEDRQGEPFVGRAGEKLNDIIRACRLTRSEIYICNILKCRPPGNRTPADDECLNCREYLLAQLRVLSPEYIVCWGAVAARNIVGSPLPIGKLRGRFHQFGAAKVLCTYHPSYLLRNPSASRDVWEDMKFLFLDMGVDLRQKP